MVTCVTFYTVDDLLLERVFKPIDVLDLVSTQ